jgi:hypothetical protein
MKKIGKRSDLYTFGGPVRHRLIIRRAQTAVHVRSYHEMFEDGVRHFGDK